jgi:hypothetical protein
MAGPFRVLTTPAFEREFRAISRKDSALVRALEELIEILSNDPHNRSGRHKIKKLAGLKPGEGQCACAGETTAFATTFLAAKSRCIPSATGKTRTERALAPEADSFEYIHPPPVGCPYLDLSRWLFSCLFSNHFVAAAYVLSQYSFIPGLPVLSFVFDRQALEEFLKIPE